MWNSARHPARASGHAPGHPPTHIRSLPLGTPPKASAGGRLVGQACCTSQNNSQALVRMHSSTWSVEQNLTLLGMATGRRIVHSCSQVAGYVRYAGGVSEGLGFAGSEGIRHAQRSSPTTSMPRHHSHVCHDPTTRSGSESLIFLLPPKECTVLRAHRAYTSARCARSKE